MSQSACSLDWAAAHRASICDCVEIRSDIFLSSKRNAAPSWVLFTVAPVAAGGFSFFSGSFLLPELGQLSVLAGSGGLFDLGEAVFLLDSTLLVGGSS